MVQNMQKNILGFNQTYGLHGNNPYYRLVIKFAYFEATL